MIITVSNNIGTTNTSIAFTIFVLILWLIECCNRLVGFELRCFLVHITALVFVDIILLQG